MTHGKINTVSHQASQVLSPAHINAIEWDQATGVARQACAKVFRDGGAPADALASFGATVTGDGDVDDWSKAVELIAETLCNHNAARKAA